MAWQIVLYSLVGSLGMLVSDATGTATVIAETRGAARLAGLMDATGDLARLVLFAYSGVALITKFSPWGWLGVVPIVLTSYLTTSKATSLSRKWIEPERTQP